MRVRRSILVLVLSLTLSGCWDRVEINDLAIMKAVAVDRTDQGVLLSARVVSPKHGPRGLAESELITEIFSAEGHSIATAAQAMQRQMSRRLFWSHSGPLILGEDLAREGVLPVLDFWSRFTEPRMNSYVIVARGQAQELLRAAPELERVLGEAVREILNMRQSLPVRISDFLGAMRTPGSNPVAARFERAPVTADEPVQEVRATGAAVFRQDRLVGWMDETETQGLLLLRDELQTALTVVKLPGGNSVSVRIVRSNTIIRAFADHGRIRIRVLIRPEGEIVDSDAPVDLGKPEVVALFERRLADTLQQTIRNTLDKLQKDQQVDVVRFGDAVRRNLPLLWDGGLEDRWDQEFPEAHVEVQIEARIRRTGAHGASLGRGAARTKKATGDLLRQMR